MGLHESPLDHGKIDHGINNRCHSPFFRLCQNGIKIALRRKVCIGQYDSVRIGGTDVILQIQIAVIGIGDVDGVGQPGIH